MIPRLPISRHYQAWHKDGSISKPRCCWSEGFDVPLRHLPGREAGGEAFKVQAEQALAGLPHMVPAPKHPQAAVPVTHLVALPAAQGH